MIVIRVAINQDGFAYWNLSGPNSVTAADAPSGDPDIAEPGDVITRMSTAPERRARPVTLRTAQVRPVASAGEASSLSVELEIEQPRDDGQAESRMITVRPREEPLLVDEASGETIELGSFDLFASASIVTTEHVPQRVETDITESIARLAGLDPDHRLRASMASMSAWRWVTASLCGRRSRTRLNKLAGHYCVR
jgi:hypothetical protein